MSSPVIKVENLSKLYRLGEVSTGTLSHDLNRWWHKVRGKEDPYLKIGQVNDRTRKVKKTEIGDQKSEAAGSSNSSPTSDNRPQTSSQNDYVYALKDINFSVNQGEVLGIIGRNGAGKSTLLKILSRVTAPTSGRIMVKGRIASLLEVGTGFHPELTGRENIYLNGAILGMRRHEIKGKLDEIVEFSGCAAYLDTPVKRYSSGMYVRLAFAVAAHLDPDILVVDEVLAVGDAEFQNKCIGKMKDVAKCGRTVVFVSHNLASLSALTTSGIVIEDGELRFQGSTTDSIKNYQEKRTTRESSANPILTRGDHTCIKKVEILNGSGKPLGFYQPGDPFAVKIALNTDGTPDLSVEIFLIDEMGHRIGIFSLRQFCGMSIPRDNGHSTLTVEFPGLFLAAGRYTLDTTTSVANVKWDHYVSNAAVLEVEYSSPGNTGWNFQTSMGFGFLALNPSSVNFENS